MGLSRSPGFAYARCVTSGILGIIAYSSASDIIFAAPLLWLAWHGRGPRAVFRVGRSFWFSGSQLWVNGLYRKPADFNRYALMEKVQIPQSVEYA